MARKKVNLAGIATEFPVVTAGTYHSTISASEYVEKGDDYIKVEFTLGEDTDGNNDFEGQKQWKNYSMKDEALFAFKRLLKDAGADDEILEGEFDPEEAIQEFHGSGIMVRVGNTTYKDKPKSEVLGTASENDF